ncbi:rod shape-determining protein MreD [Winogradskyella litoriviva]|uniref:Rod shape-determining protein MreD n=1 Tax=Winogradskyella litoriviva TaxID=1220182 RepID=A0ABX2E4C1_9FLAO|nr:rod shape-determining protein MreD [Winogradskyella litoriviva]NRD23132.1 rod shape-determining protein MreD [Winogradskyella litoriviva]
MNNVISINTIRFVVLLLLQVLICNQIDFFGFINPYIYIIFIFLFPIKDERLLLLLTSFLLGMLIDLFSDSGGVHAAAAVSLAYVRPILLKSSFGMLYEHHSIKFSTTDIGSLITYITFGTIIHHFILFSLEIFNISNILLILQKTLFSSIFTIILSILIIILFSRNKK